MYFEHTCERALRAGVHSGSSGGTALPCNRIDKYVSK